MNEQKRTKKLFRIGRDDVRAMINADNGDYNEADNNIVDSAERALFNQFVRHNAPYSLYWDTATKNAEQLNPMFGRARRANFADILIIFRPRLKELRRRLEARNRKNGRRVDLKVAEKIWRSVNREFPRPEKRKSYPVYVNYIFENDTTDAKMSRFIIEFIAGLIGRYRVFIMTVGAPGSGKTTFFRELSKKINE